jgi:hypothetical protein
MWMESAGFTLIYNYIYIYIYVCVCACVCVYTRNFYGSLTKLSVVQTMQFRPIRSLKNELAGMYKEVVRINFR